jgi:hypothetical protein
MAVVPSTPATYPSGMRLWKAFTPAAKPTATVEFDPNSSRQFQARMTRAPAWFCSFLAGNQREQRRFRDELAAMRGAWPLLMKQRRGGQWSAQDREQLKAMVRSASSVSPYLFIWAIPGSVLLLPFLAWYLDTRRQQRIARESQL